jgi:hypothetical protein
MIYNGVKLKLVRIFSELVCPGQFQDGTVLRRSHSEPFKGVECIVY